MFNFLGNIIIFDGFINALSFFKSYISFKMNTPLNIDKTEIKKDTLYSKIIEKAQIYNLDTIERYLIYTLFSIGYLGINKMIEIFLNCNLNDEFVFNYSLSLMCSMPFLQNILFKKAKVEKYISRKNLFFRYSFSRFILNYIKNLNPKISGIKNYHTFILSRYIKWKLIIDTFKTFLFISLLYILRDNETTYYYYKAIKLSYFYNKGYLFNIIDQGRAVNIINELIKNKKWDEISNEENSNAFYCLIIDNMSKNIKINKTFIYIVLLFFSSIWSIFCFINLVSLHLIALISYICICIIGTIFEIFTINFAKRVIISGLVSFILCYLYLNELILTIIYFSMIYNKIPKYILNEVIFFLKNYKDIEKVVDFYDKK